MATSFEKKSITSEGAFKAILAAEKKAREIGVPMCISITDESGVLKAFTRMDGAPQLSVDISRDKAYSAIAFGIPTHVWFDFIKDDGPLLHGITKTPHLIIFGGGYPIKEGDAIIGGIGVSGGHYHQDQEVAEAGLAALS